VRTRQEALARRPPRCRIIAIVEKLDGKAVDRMEKISDEQYLA
jgi:hypothetical protein